MFFFELPYQNTWHPFYDKKADFSEFKEKEQFSLTGSIGSPTEHSFSTSFIHSGRIVQSRSPESIYLEALALSKHQDFQGIFSDIKADSNLLFSACSVWKQNGFCKERHCFLPQKCPHLKLNYPLLTTVYQNIKNIPGVKNLFIKSKLEYSLLLDDKDAEEYLISLCKNNTTGKIKIFPEHTEDRVLKLMNKASYGLYKKFKLLFRRINKKTRKQVFLVNNYMTAHPGADLEKAINMGLHGVDKKVMPEQIKDFIPLPMTISAAMFYTKTHPLTLEKVFVPESIEERMIQRALVQDKNQESPRLIKKALQKAKKIYLYKKFIK